MCDPSWSWSVMIITWPYLRVFRSSSDEYFLLYCRPRILMRLLISALSIIWNHALILSVTYIQYCAKVMRAKFVLCSHKFSRKFRTIFRKSFFENSKNFRRNVAWKIENLEKLTKVRRNEVSNKRNSEEFLHKKEESSRNFRRNERNMEISWRSYSKINITLCHPRATLWHACMNCIRFHFIAHISFALQ